MEIIGLFAGIGAVFAGIGAIMILICFLNGARLAISFLLEFFLMNGPIGLMFIGLLIGGFLFLQPIGWLFLFGVGAVNIFESNSGSDNSL